ncbi:uncharacterized protein Dwil_GK26830 [Drosophila willistoni]|uniref:Uncharacterized protein n=1 Tax=Drosophila willistoni TaxID=7260 RepID=A0A0Q9WZF8_DROWI|nr:uncharacterized protein Dwil_GK26830 [Drosophila willistoni]
MECRKYWKNSAVFKINPDSVNNNVTPKNCICERPRNNVIVCEHCQKSFFGRISQTCPEHPEVAFLMDARNCGFCGAPANYLKIVGIKKN